MNIATLLNERGGIQLDIGCGATKQGPEWVGMDLRDLPGVDIVHNVLTYPWPLPDESVIRAVCSHLVEHIPPSPPDPRIATLVQLLIDKEVMTADEAGASLGDWRDSMPRFIRFMNEIWRVVKPDGQLAIVCPHGYSPGQLQDPSHCNPSNEATWAYFDPLESHAGGALYRIYRPKPWELIHITWAPDANMEVLMRRRRDDRSYYE